MELTGLMQKALQNLSITDLNEMQKAFFEIYDSNKDIILLSPTGSGKTLAFLLPLLKNLNDEKTGIQALILTPSRELALQIESVFKTMSSGLRVGCCYGGHSMLYEERMLENPPALLIGTPGRIKDHIIRENLSTENIRFLILDEFDKSLEFGFTEEMSFIISRLHSLEKRILLSATEAEDIPDFTGITDPFELNFLSEKKPENILRIHKVISSQKDKLDTLFHLICQLGNEPTLVFCNYRESVERIGAFLQEKGIICKMFHGGMEQQDREKALCLFRNGSCYLLVSTDLAARGLDIPDIKNIIHYHFPVDRETFVHRNGRTARMFAEGDAFIILHGEEKIPEFIEQDYPVFSFSDNKKLPAKPFWDTLYIGKGKKDKLSKKDIAGFLMQKGGLKKESLGKIEIKDHYSFAAVEAKRIDNLIKIVGKEKIKGLKTCFEKAR